MFKRIDHVEIVTEQPDETVAFYTDILGLTLTEKSKDAVYLASTVDHHSVVLRAGPQAQCVGVGFQLGLDDDRGQQPRHRRQHQARGVGRLFLGHHHQKLGGARRQHLSVAHDAAMHQPKGAPASERVSLEGFYQRLLAFKRRLSAAPLSLQVAGGTSMLTPSTETSCITIGAWVASLMSARS